jgi:hypothetical protein
LKKYVPEVYELLGALRIGKGTETTPEPTPEKVRVTETGEEDLKGVSVKPSQSEEEDFVEMSSTDLPKLSSLEDSSIETSSAKEIAKDENKKKLGKHVVVKETLSHYEPKLMAEAVRTMMKKNED